MTNTTDMSQTVV